MVSENPDREISPAEIDLLSYHEVCGTIDGLAGDHPSLPALQARAEDLRAANPRLRHYADAMR